ARAIDTTSDTYSPGTLSGIIGRTRALGAFISDDDGAGSAATSFAGGFVARPRIAAIDDVTELADYDNWVKGANPRSNRDTSVQFQLTHSHATADRLILSESTNENTTVEKFSDAQYNGVSLVGMESEMNFEEDGFAYLQVDTVDNSGFDPVIISFFAAGILSDTNMGAPLTQAPAVANWIGEIYSVSNAYGLPAASNPVSSDLTLTIGFANGSGTISGTSTLESVNNNHGLDSVLTYTLSAGSFDTSGVMTGDIEVNVNPKTDMGNSDNRRTKIIEGNFSGLIGARGAVAAFVANGFAGGFFAVPRSFATDTDVNYGDWAEVVTTDVATPSTPLKNE
nr:hypothetical protein [Pseudomonadota bacterium]